MGNMREGCSSRKMSAQTGLRRTAKAIDLVVPVALPVRANEAV
jgi:hypothetical protein